MTVISHPFPTGFPKRIAGVTVGCSTTTPVVLDHYGRKFSGVVDVHIFQGAVLSYLSKAVYLDTEIVSLDYEHQTITLNIVNVPGTVQSNCRDVMNLCSDNFRLPFSVWFSKARTYLELNKRFVYRKVVPFLPRMVIPFKPDVVEIDPATIVRPPGSTQAFFVSFERNQNGQVEIWPLSTSWSARIKKHLAMFGGQPQRAITLSEIEGERAIKTWLSRVQEGRLNGGYQVLVEVPIKYYLQTYVGFDSEIWLL